MSSVESDNADSPKANGYSMASLLRPFSEQSETDRPFIPVVGGPRLFLLLLYLSVVVVASIEFFASMSIWYGSWELYNTYVFTVSGVFVFLGMILLFMSRKTTPDDYNLPVPRWALGAIGFAMLALSGLALVLAGDEVGGWAIILSLVLVYGFTLMALGARGISRHDGIRLALYGTGVSLMILVPVHEAFGYAQSDPSEYPWTLLNLILLTVGMTAAVFAAQSLQTRDGFLGAWLIGAMGIFLIAFHEQLGIIASGNYSPYDRTLALIGITFSFLPLAMYVWRERVYIFLWRRLRAANDLIAKGEYKAALVQADAAMKQCSRVGIEDRFALPWAIKADALYRAKDYQRATLNYLAALDIESNDSVSWCHLGNMYAFDDKHKDALKAYDAALKADPGNGFAWNNKGAVLQSMGAYQDALIAFDKATQFESNSFDAHMNMAKLLSKLGHSDEALPHYRAALSVNPESRLAKEGIEREFFRGMCLDQINGWEMMGLDTTPMRTILAADPDHFVQRSKDWLQSIVDQRSEIALMPGKQHIDIAKAMDLILQVTSASSDSGVAGSDETAQCPVCHRMVSMGDRSCPSCGAEFEMGVYEGPGATLEMLSEETGLREKDLILPLALLMTTDRIHFKTVGSQQVYVSKGKAPEAPLAIPIAPLPTSPFEAPEQEPVPAEPVAAERPPEPVPERPVQIATEAPESGLGDEELAVVSSFEETLKDIVKEQDSGLESEIMQIQETEQGPGQEPAPEPEPEPEPAPEPVAEPAPEPEPEPAPRPAPHEPKVKLRKIEPHPRKVQAEPPPSLREKLGLKQKHPQAKPRPAAEPVRKPVHKEAPKPPPPEPPQPKRKWTTVTVEPSASVLVFKKVDKKKKK